MILSFTEDEGNIYNEILEIVNDCKSFEWDDVSQNTEFEILYLLANNPGRAFSKAQIYDIVWQEPYSGDYNIVMSHIHNIRKKIEDNPSKPIYIQTVWGVVYRFNKNLIA